MYMFHTFAQVTFYNNLKMHIFMRFLSYAFSNC